METYLLELKIVISFELDQLGNDQNYDGGSSRDTFKITITNVLEGILPNGYIVMMRYDDNIYPRPL